MLYKHNIYLVPKYFYGPLRKLSTKHFLLISLSPYSLVITILLLSLWIQQNYFEPRLRNITDNWNWWKICGIWFVKNQKLSHSLHVSWSTVGMCQIGEEMLEVTATCNFSFDCYKWVVLNSQIYLYFLIGLWELTSFNKLANFVQMWATDSSCLQFLCFWFFLVEEIW